MPLEVLQDAIEGGRKSDGRKPYVPECSNSRALEVRVVVSNRNWRLNGSFLNRQPTERDHRQADETQHCADEHSALHTRPRIWGRQTRWACAG